jgi:asparagine synthase (glutamine-hydrolysing)
MVESMHHRGPDDYGTHVTHDAVLGARRLSIIDVAGGHQPFANESQDVWAVQNGEIYNHEVLRSRLRGGGHRFASRCDTEVIPHLYEAHGNDFVDHLRGMFAIAVWDERRKRGVLARDRLGIKPLYYAERDGRLIFASELKSLLASGTVEPAIDLESLELFLTLGLVPAPRTLLQDVWKLPPGHRLVVESGRARVERYWRYPLVAGPSRDADADAAQWAAAVREALRESVRLRLMSDVPLGAMLSGGLDSSLIVALMAEQMSRPVQTFAVGLAGSATSELGDARRVAAALGADHHELELDNSGPDLDELIWHLDEPLADLSALGFLALSGLAREHVTVALSGQGADEVFSGYRHHLHARYASLWSQIPRPVAGPLLAAARRGPERLRRLADVVGPADPALRSLAGKRIADESDLALLLGRERSAIDPADVIRPLVPDGVSDPVAASLSIDAQLSLPDDMLHYFDRASMAHSLEVRVPFLDHEFVELCARIPSNLKLRGTTTKYVLREAARGLVPDYVLEKKKVGFFNGTVTTWLSDTLERDGVELLLPGAPAYADLIDRRGVEQLLRAQATHPTARRGHLLLAVLLLERWLQSYLPRATSQAPATPALLASK